MQHEDTTAVSAAGPGMDARMTSTILVGTQDFGHAADILRRAAKHFDKVCVTIHNGRLSLSIVRSAANASRVETLVMIDPKEGTP